MVEMFAFDVVVLAVAADLQELEAVAVVVAVATVLDAVVVVAVVEPLFFVVLVLDWLQEATDQEEQELEIAKDFEYHQEQEASYLPAVEVSVPEE